MESVEIVKRVIAGDTFETEGAEKRPVLQTLLKSLSREGGALRPVCVDTGGGHEDRACCAPVHDAGHPVSAARSLSVNEFAESPGSRNRTDRTDAWVNARLALQRYLASWKSKGKAQIIPDRQEGRDAAKPRCRQTRSVEEEQVRIEKTCRQPVATTPEFAAPNRLPTTIPGVGPRTIAVLCATVAASDFGDPGMPVARARLTQGGHQSATSLGHIRLAKIGNQLLCRALLLAVPLARMCSHVIRAFTERPAKNQYQLSKKQAIPVCARRRLRIRGVRRARKPPSLACARVPFAGVDAQGGIRHIPGNGRSWP